MHRCEVQQNCIGMQLFCSSRWALPPLDWFVIGLFAGWAIGAGGGQVHQTRINGTQLPGGRHVGA